MLVEKMTKVNQINLWEDALLDESQESPFDFMREQGEVLREQTQGRLWGEVKFFIGNDEITYHHFEIISEALEDYRCLLLRTAHAKHIFPLYIYDYSQSDEALQPSYKYVTETRRKPVDPFISELRTIETTHEVKVKNTKGKFFAPPPDFEADDFNKFVNHFARILKSNGTRAIVQSLLLQSHRQADF